MIVLIVEQVMILLMGAYAMTHFPVVEDLYLMGAGNSRLYGSLESNGEEWDDILSGYDQNSTLLGGTAMIDFLVIKEMTISTDKMKLIKLMEMNRKISLIKLTVTICFIETWCLLVIGRWTTIFKVYPVTDNHLSKFPNYLPC